jgi:hypothetical protein
MSLESSEKQSEVTETVTISRESKPPQITESSIDLESCPLDQELGFQYLSDGKELTFREFGFPSIMQTPIIMSPPAEPVEQFARTIELPTPI